MKKLKLILTGVILGVMTSQINPIYAQMQTVEAFFNDIKISINGKVIDTGEDKAFIYNGRTYIPARHIAQGLGATVKWNETDNTVEILTNNIQNDTKKNIKRMSEKELDMSIYTLSLTRYVYRMGDWEVKLKTIQSSFNEDKDLNIDINELLDTIKLSQFEYNTVNVPEDAKHIDTEFNNVFSFLVASVMNISKSYSLYKDNKIEDAKDYLQISFDNYKYSKNCMDLVVKYVKDYSIKARE